MIVTANEFNNAMDVTFDEGIYCTSFESPVGQSFDHFIAMLTAEPGQSPTANSPAFVTVIDNKSGMVSPDETLGKKGLNYAQFYRFQTLVEKLRNLSETGEIKLSRISRALVEGRYRFVYLTTYVELAFNSFKHPNLVVSDAKSSKDFYGMVWPLVQSLRSASSNKYK